jgi:predicted nucleic acid-binding protein
MTIMAVEPEFIDTNILVFGVLTSSPLHAQAVQALEEREQAGVELWISRQILREYVSALTRGVPGTSVVPMPAVVTDLVAFQSRYRIAEDGQSVTDQFLMLLGAVPVGGKQVHDANIVATMLAHGLKRLLTHNVADFRRFSAWIDVIPLVPTP